MEVQYKYITLLAVDLTSIREWFEVQIIISNKESYLSALCNQI